MIVLAAYPKAGSTWLRMLLSAYRVNAALNINDMYYRFGDPCTKYLQLISPVGLDKVTREQFWCLRYGAVELFRMREHPAHQVYKTHGARVHYKGMPWMPDHWIDRVIYVVRDPRDIAVSYSRHTGKTPDEMADVLGDEGAWSNNAKTPNVGQPLSTWSYHVAGWLTDDLPVPKLVVRYEDMLKDTEGALTAALRFVGCPEEEITSERVAESVKVCKIDRLRRQEETYGFLEASARNEGKFFWRGKAGGWKEDLSPKAADKIASDHEHMMKQLGYLEDESGGTNTD